ncbi:MAG: hypothetical protein M3317_12485 [Actinomycetota bacterium]|nr:hypothetical protein [Actinomycetota bacterium]
MEWSAGIALALGGGVGTYVATLVANQRWAKIWVYRLLVAGVILSIIQPVMVNARGFLQFVLEPAPVGASLMCDRCGLREGPAFAAGGYGPRYYRWEGQPTRRP